MKRRDTLPIAWIKAARRAFVSVPEGAQNEILRALTVAAEGQKADIAKPLNGVGAGVFEVVLQYRTDAYRTVYALQLGERLGAAVCGRRVFATNSPGWASHTHRRSSASPTQCNGGIERFIPDPEETVSLAPSLRDAGRGAGDHRGLHPTLQRGVDHRTARLSDPGHRQTGARVGGLTKATACPRNRVRYKQTGPYSH